MFQAEHFRLQSCCFPAVAAVMKCQVMLNPTSVVRAGRSWGCNKSQTGAGEEEDMASIFKGHKYISYEWLLLFQVQSASSQAVVAAVLSTSSRRWTGSSTYRRTWSGKPIIQQSIRHQEPRITNQKEKFRLDLKVLKLNNEQ